MSIFKNLFGPGTKENKPLPVAYAKIADVIFHLSLVTLGQSVEIVEKATFSKIGDAKGQALLREVVAYHLSVAYANVMVKNKLYGKENYEHIEGDICNAISRVLMKPGDKLAQYLPIIDKENRDKALMYFSKDAHGLRISDEQVNWYAARYNKPIKDVPADQMAMVYYTMCVARLVTTGQEIDKFVVHYVNNVLLDRALQLQNDVCKLLA